MGMTPCRHPVAAAVQVHVEEVRVKVVAAAKEAVLAPKVPMPVTVVSRICRRPRTTRAEWKNNFFAVKRNSQKSKVQAQMKATLEAHQPAKVGVSKHGRRLRVPRHRLEAPSDAPNVEPCSHQRVLPLVAIEFATHAKRNPANPRRQVPNRVVWKVPRQVPAAAIPRIWTTCRTGQTTCVRVVMLSRRDLPLPVPVQQAVPQSNVGDY
jgi:hypothetical protein